MKNLFFVLILSSVIAQSQTPAKSEVLMTLPCSKEQGTSFELRKVNCDGRCEIEITLKKGESVLGSKKTGFMMYFPAGKQEKIANGSWWFGEIGDTKGTLGKTHVLVEPAKGPKNTRSFMIATTTVSDGDGLPATSYEYYVCNENMLYTAWSGNNEDSFSPATIGTKDVDSDGVDEILIDGGSFSAPGYLGVSKAQLFWDEKSKSMVVKYPKQATFLKDLLAEQKKTATPASALNMQPAQDAKQEKELIFRGHFKGLALDHELCAQARKTFPSCVSDKSTCEIIGVGQQRVHCYFLFEKNLANEESRSSPICKNINQSELQGNGQPNYMAFDCKFP